MDVQISLGDVGHIIVFEVEDTLGVLDNGGGIRGYKVLDRLRSTIITKESSRAGTTKLRHRGRVIEWTTGLFISIDAALRAELNIDKVHLQLLLSLNTDDQRRSTTSAHSLVGIMHRFDD
jgi:hypothetical protein